MTSQSQSDFIPERVEVRMVKEVQIREPMDGISWSRAYAYSRPGLAWEVHYYHAGERCRHTFIGSLTLDFARAVLRTIQVDQITFYERNKKKLDLIRNGVYVWF